MLRNGGEVKDNGVHTKLERDLMQNDICLGFSDRLRAHRGLFQGYRVFSVFGE